MVKFLIALVLSWPFLALATDWLIVPGERFGPIQANSAESDLVQLFGADNVQPSASIDVGEGMTEPGTVIFPNDPSKTAVIFWTDSTRAAPAVVRVRSVGTRWKTDKGITIGTSLRALQKINGRPFVISGFGWDYGGTVVDWRGGRLSGRDPSQIATTRLTIRLGVDSSRQEMPAYKHVIGDKDFSSANDAMQTLNPNVYELQYVFEKASSPTP